MILQIPSSTVTMILVSVFFLLLQIPNDSYTLKNAINGYYQSSSLDSANKKLFFSVMVYLSYLNSSINFINYFVTGRRFRQAAVNTMMFRWRNREGLPKGKPTKEGRLPEAATICTASYSVTKSKTTTPSTSVQSLQE